MLAMAVLFGAAVARADTTRLWQAFDSPSDAAKPWVFWYWLDAAVTADGITADLQAMRDTGIGGAYLMPINGPQDPPLIEPPATQLSPHWWGLVRHAAEEADRLGLRLAMHLCDGFAVAGGPWITPELSMQRVVWSTATAVGGQSVELSLPQPPTRENYYQDIAVLAFPTPVGEGLSTATVPVAVTTNAAGQQAQQLVVPGNTERLRSAEPCWIAFEFERPFTCRSITLRPDGANYQCQRLRLEAGDDGQTYRTVAQLAPPRHGWQDEGCPVTHAVPETTARFFRLVFNPAGSEPGAEDLDSAKWSPVLKVQGVELSGAARVHQFRGKSGAVWRVASPNGGRHEPECAVDYDAIVDLSANVDKHGVLRWGAPPGEWTILRFGHTSTGKQNATGGGAKGLECDKLNPAAVRLQYENWFGAARGRLGDELASRVLTRLHVDSWECGSQNWTATLAQQFMKRRGYAARPWLPALAGYLINDAETSDRFLRDFRRTIAEQLDESFFGTLAAIADEQSLEFTAECTAPTMLSDGLRHFQHVDVPMGEFWLRSPTHDKPNDLRDAVSAGHIYGKRVIGAEAFTQLRVRWDETPALLKPLADRHYCQGVNQLTQHVWMHNPWPDRKPGVTLNGVGAFLQRDQVWRPHAHAWNAYQQRLQSVLQLGAPVVDIGVFTGEELPSRAVLPERLIGALPGLIGEQRVTQERKRLANRGAPTRELPAGVRHSANMVDPADWLDPLRGYQYDSINRDALLRLATVKEGRIVLPGGASYALLVVPAARPMAPSPQMMSIEVVEKLLELADSGGRVLLAEMPSRAPGLPRDADERLADVAVKLAKSPQAIPGPWVLDTLDPLGTPRDLEVFKASGEPAAAIAWTHRQGEGWDVYLVSNQADAPRELTLRSRVRFQHAELWRLVTAERERLSPIVGGLPVELAPFESVLLVLSQTPGVQRAAVDGEQTKSELSGAWRIEFQNAVGQPPVPMTLDSLQDLTTLPEPALRSFAGVACYATQFGMSAPRDDAGRAWLDLGNFAGTARVFVNGKACGVAWTPPYRVEVTNAIRPGANQLQIEVAGVWRNQILADAKLPERDRLTWTNARPLPDSAGPVPFGLLGPVLLTTTSTAN